MNLTTLYCYFRPGIQVGDVVRIATWGYVFPGGGPFSESFENAREQDWENHPILKAREANFIERREYPEVVGFVVCIIPAYKDDTHDRCYIRYDSSYHIMVSTDGLEKLTYEELPEQVKK